MMSILWYWLLPGRIRRLPSAGRILLAIIYVGVTIGVAVAILNVRTSYPTRASDALYAAWTILVFGLPATFSVVGMFAGASLIAGERQKQTWESLLLSPVSIHTVVSL